MLKKQMTVGYQYRQSRRCNISGVGPLFRDLPTAPKIILANHFLTESGFSIGDKVLVEYLKGSIIISKIN
ncbi:type I addiction module toxin, SymE family [Candidatus Nomurabacteria bacterium]|nr:type I addiction module toxin, SymE family [Candidatus Nomurabacteria bacterium]